MSASPTARAAADLSSLPSFGRYEPAFRIAAGGMAEVYGARAVGEAGFKKWVALKRMLPHLSEEERFVEMFLDEARIASNIHSPHVVSTLDLGRASDGSVFLVMDLVIGATLSTLLRGAAKAGTQLPLAVAIEIVTQAALGLHEAHEARTAEGVALDIVHRDVSPQNILVGVDGRTRIMDFGVARATMRETRTRTGEVKGKLSYFSPEQAAIGELDRRSDVFALGIVAWESLAGRRLFHAENPLAILSRLTQMPVPELDELCPETIPREIARVISRALVRDRETRTQSAAIFAQELRAAAQAYDLVPAAEAVAAAVRAHGGDAVGQLESAIRTVPTGTRPLATASAVSRTKADVDDGTVTTPSEPMGMVLDIVAEPAPAKEPTAHPRAGSPRRLAMIAIALGTGVALIAAAFLSGILETPSGPAMPDAIAAPLPVASPEVPVVVAPPAPIEVSPAAPVTTAELAPPRGEASPVAPVSPRHGSSRRPRARSGEAVASEPAIADAPPERAPEPTTTSPPSRTGGLRGVDSFERSIGL